MYSVLFVSHKLQNISNADTLRLCTIGTFFFYPIPGLDRLLGLQDIEAPIISVQSVHEGGKVVTQTHRPPLPSGVFLLLTRVIGCVDPRIIVRPEGLRQ